MRGMEVDQKHPAGLWVVWIWSGMRMASSRGYSSFCADFSPGDFTSHRLGGLISTQLVAVGIARHFDADSPLEGDAVAMPVWKLAASRPDASERTSKRRA